MVCGRTPHCAPPVLDAVFQGNLFWNGNFRTAV